jgi:hypothetical protein
VQHPSTKARELLWVTTCLTSDPTEDSAPGYADWEARASLLVAIDILTTHNHGIRHFGFKGQTVETSKGLLDLVACALQALHKMGTDDSIFDRTSIENLAESLSFSDIGNKTM